MFPQSILVCSRAPWVLRKSIPINTFVVVKEDSPNNVYKVSGSQLYYYIKKLLLSPSYAVYYKSFNKLYAVGYNRISVQIAASNGVLSDTDVNRVVEILKSTNTINIPSAIVYIDSEEVLNTLGKQPIQDDSDLEALLDVVQEHLEKIIRTVDIVEAIKRILETEKTVSEIDKKNTDNNIWACFRIDSIGESELVFKRIHLQLIPQDIASNGQELSNEDNVLDGTMFSLLKIVPDILYNLEQTNDKIFLVLPLTTELYLLMSARYECAQFLACFELIGFLDLEYLYFSQD